MPHAESPPELNFAATYLRAAAERRGWDVLLHPDGSFAGQIRLADRSMRYFVRSSYDLNTTGASEVARDKALTKFFLRRAGFPAIPGETFFSEGLAVKLRSRRNRAAARRYALRLGLPVMVKANSGAGGEAVERVGTAADLDGALDRAFAADDVVLIEQYVAGMRDFRLLVLDGTLLLAYERIPFRLTGDGRSSLRALMNRFVRGAARRGTGTPPAERVERMLSEAGLNWSDVLPPGAAVALDVANLSQGGTARDVTTRVHPKLAALAVDATRAIGLRYCGVDLLTTDVESARGPQYVIELNAAPTIHQFAKLTRMRDSRLHTFYDRLLGAMAER